MTEHHPETPVCDCPGLRTLATEYLDREAPAGPVHRPSSQSHAAIALNDDAALLAAINRAFRG